MKLTLLSLLAVGFADRDYYSLFQNGPDPVIPNYAVGVKWAQADDRPLVLYVGVKAEAIPGCIVCRQDYAIPLDKGVYVSWFDKNGHTAAYPFKVAPTRRQVYASLLQYGQRPPQELLCRCGLNCPHGDACDCGDNCKCAGQAPPVQVPANPAAAPPIFPPLFGRLPRFGEYCPPSG